MRWLVLAIACACAEPHAAPSPTPAPPTARGFTAAQLDQHIAALRARLAAKGLPHMSIRVEHPFVVIGDAGDATLASEAQLVRWAADRLERDFFAVEPSRILDIFLFHGADPYEAGVIALTAHPPDTPFGFYSPDDNALFMNISTGGGTLVHEIVHPYVEADFPGAPPWLNEGLGSLFEQSADQDGHIVGRTNWRLAGLQRALARGTVPSFRELTSLKSLAF